MTPAHDKRTLNTSNPNTLKDSVPQDHINNHNKKRSSIVQSTNKFM
jgi:hypothetical protein